MDDSDLQLLRAYRADDARPTPGLLERLEEDVLQAILDEADGRRRPTATPVRARAGTRGRFADWLGAGALARPVLAGAAVLVLVSGVALLSDGGARSIGESPTTTASVTQASSNPFDATASALFGSGATTAPPAASAITQARSADERARMLEAGPGTTAELARERSMQLPADEGDLRALLRRASDGLLADAVGQDARDVGDRVAFHVGMRWVVDPLVPGPTRAAILRSLAGLDDIDRAVRGNDLLGRSGIVLSHYDERTGLREQYVLNPEGGDVLERRAFTTAYVVPGCPPGTFTQYALYDHGTRLEQAQVPWIDWPVTIDQCDPSDVRIG